MAESLAAKIDVKEGAQKQDVCEHPVEDKVLSWAMVAAYTCGVLLALYAFLVGLTLMGSAFQVLGGKGAGNLFNAANNPIAGLMTGVLSTVLVQSSSTSTSIVVAMVGADQLTVENGIPIVMGANIGTSVTNTMISLTYLGNRVDLERAFAGATVHDMFNMLTVATLLPLEVLIGAIQGEGGPLYWISYAITERLTNGNKGEPMFTSPIKAITKPVASAILSANKYVIRALALGAPVAQTPARVNTTLCKSTRRLDSISEQSGHAPTVGSSPPSSNWRRMANDDRLEDCSQYYCVGKDLDNNFKKISASSYKKLTTCNDYILDGDGELCGHDKCYLDAGKYYDDKVSNGHVVKGGFLKDTGDLGGGIIGLNFALLLLTFSMIALCWMLKRIFLGKAKKLIKYALKVNDYVAILIGMVITIIVQSSSAVTSALTNLAGIGVLPLPQMLPLTLGANIGTTCTALMASLVSLKFGAVQIALVHLLFNVHGVLIWFPIPHMRRIPVAAAELLGLYASHFRVVPVLYMCVAFLIIPGVCLGVSEIFNASVEAGVTVLLLLIIALAAFLFLWWHGLALGASSLLDGEPWCFKVLSKQQREESKLQLAKANAVVRQAGGVQSSNDANGADDEQPAKVVSTPDAEMIADVLPAKDSTTVEMITVDV